MVVKSFETAYNQLKDVAQSYLSTPTSEFDVICLNLIENLTSDAFIIEDRHLERAQLILDFINIEKIYKMDMIVNSLQTLEDNILYYNYIHFILYFEQHLM